MRMETRTSVLRVQSTEGKKVRDMIVSAVLSQDQGTLG